MREANPDRWKRVMQLTHACPEDALTELCETAMAVRTILAAPEVTRTEMPTAAPLHPSPYGK
jgi:hypothetical protein